MLVDIYGGPGHQEVVAAAGRAGWSGSGGPTPGSRWSRSTTGVRPGVAPSFEKVIHRRLADVILTDQVDALARARRASTPTSTWPGSAIRGWSFGGWLAALAVLRRPDVYRCAVVGAPVTDWTLYDTAYTERYLGLPDDGRTSTRTTRCWSWPPSRPCGPDEARPMLLVHGLADDNVVAAHTLRLSAALLAAGRPHAVIPLTGATHMAAGGTAERLLPLELDFLRTHLL